MSPPLELLAFAGVMALGQFSPGPDMILLTRTALRSGARAGVEMALGIACGLAVHATTTYDILRHKGVPIGKRDFMGRLKLKT